MENEIKLSMNNQLQEALLSVDEFNRNKDNQDSDNIKTISIVADRGFGKTTFLNILKEELRNDQSLMVSDIIDPINLMKGPENTYLITELILYTVYKELKDSQNCNSNILLKKISALVEERNNMQKGYMSSQGTGLSILSKLETVFNFKSSIDSILNDTEKKLVLLFDDFDLVENKIISEILNELHEFLGTKNIIFIFAYRERQLQNAVSSSITKENKLLLEQKKISMSDISSQVNSKLIKLFPSASKVFLPRIEEFYNSQEGITGKTKREYIISTLNSILNIRVEPARPIENINAILPQSPREYKQMKSFLDKLENSQNGANDTIYRLEKFEKFLVTRIIESDIDFYLKDLVENYISVHMSEKNGVIINHVRNYVKTLDKKDLNNSCTFTNERDIINSSISDVIETLNDLLDYDASLKMMNYVYSLKLLISIKLKHQSLLIKHEQDTNIKFSYYSSYMDHINGYFIPLTKSYYGNMRDFSNININNFASNRICREELELAFLSLISLHNQGPKFTDNSSFMEYVAKLDESKPYDIETEKGNLINRGSKNRVNNLIKLFEYPRMYLGIEIMDLQEFENLEKLLKNMMSLNGYNYSLSNMIMRFDPLNIFLRYDVMINHMEKGFDKLIVDNIFDIEEMQAYNYYRQGEYYSVANVVKRNINRHYPEYVKNNGILTKYITLPEDENETNGKRLIELEKRKTDADRVRELCNEYDTVTNTGDPENRSNERLYILISELSKFKAKDLTAKTLSKAVIGEIKHTYEDVFGVSRKAIPTKIYELNANSNLKIEDDLPF